MALNKTTNSFGSGLYTESTRIKAPEGTYTFALNSMIGSREGDAATLTNENSNTVCITLPEPEGISNAPFSVIGATLLANGNVVLFYTNNEISYIGLHDTRSCTLHTLVRSSCLGFKTYRQIRALNRIIKGCENVVYFTDRVSAYKSINIDNLELYLADGFSDVDTANADPNADGWNCIKFNHFLSFDYGCIESAEVINSGGSLKYGSHQFTFRYLDADLNPTNWHILSNPVFIYSENTQGALDSIDGEPFSNTATANKSIDLTVINLDQEFKYVQFAVAQSVNGLGTVSDVYILELVPITATNLTYNYSGFNQNIHTASTFAEITIPTIFVEAVGAHEQIDNRLFLANVKTFTEDWALLQRATLLTETKWFTYKDTEIDEINLNNERNASKNPDILFTNKTVTRDEIYALGLVFVFDNSTESPVFHIPGRPADTDYDGVDIATYTSPGDHFYRGGDDNPVNLLGDWDTQLLEVVPDGTIISSGVSANNDVRVAFSDVAHIPDSEFSNCPVVTLCDPITDVEIEVEFVTGLNPNDSIRIAFTSGMTGNRQANVRVVRYDASMSVVFQDTFLHFDSLTTQVITDESNSGDPSDYVGLIIMFTDGDCTYNTLTVISKPENGVLGVQTILLSPTIDGNVIDYLQPKASDTGRVGCEIERWKVHNTAVITDTLPDDNHEGLMGYYEIAMTYPDTIDCDSLEVFDASGADYGNDPRWNFVGQPIRHHRIPDCALAPTGDLANSEWEYVNDEFNRTTELKKMGIKLDISSVLTAINNVNPDLFSRIQGYYLVYGERNEANKTVLDKGFAWKLYKERELFSGNPQYPPIPTNFEERHYQLNDTFTDTGLVGLRTYALDNTPNAIVPFSIQDMIINLYNNVINVQRADGSPLAGSSPESDLWEIYTEEQGEINEYVSPRVIYRNEMRTGNYSKIERMIRCRRDAVGAGQIEGACDVVNSTGDIETRLRFDRFAYYGYKDYVEYEYNEVGLFTSIPAELGFQRKVLAGYVVPYNTDTNVIVSKTGDSYPLYSSDGRQQSGLFETEHFFSPAFRSSSPSAADISLMNYAARAPFDYDVRDTILPNGYTGIYIAMKNYRDVFTSIGDITYLRFEGCMRPITDTTPYIVGGDTFITQMRAVKTRAHRDGATPDVANEFGSFQGHAISFRGYVESDINTSLAMSDTPESQYATKYFPYLYFLKWVDDQNNTFNAEILNGDPDNIDDIVTYGQYQFAYNPDFGKNNIENAAFPLDINYDYCNECEGKESNNIYYSEKSFSADKSDNYKLIAANNLLSIPSDSGVITNLFTEQDQLYTHTEKALWQVQIRPQELTTNEGQVQVGTGEIGSIPPKRIVSTTTGYAGSQDPFATIGTQYGTFFIDAQVGRVFLFGKGLNEISNVGMEQWFKDYGMITFRDQFYELTSELDPDGNGVFFPNRDTSTNDVVGYQAVYDPIMDRMILHKKDYRILDTVDFQGLPPDGEDPKDGALYYQFTDTDYVQFMYWDEELGEYVIIDFNNPDYFQNLSWTISYSLDLNVWVSWHSYQPNFMYSDRNTYYTYIDRLEGRDRHVWKHMIPFKYQEFYETRYPHIVEVIENSESIQEKVFYNIQYISDTFEYIAGSQNFVRREDITYDAFEIYNGSQSTTQRDLVVKTPNSYIDVTLPLTQSIVDRTDDYWRISRFRDEVVDYTQPHHTYDWSQLQPYFDLEGQGYIDKVVDPAVVDSAKSIYQLARFRNKFCAIRLSFNPETDYKIVTEVISVLINQSLR